MKNNVEEPNGLEMLEMKMKCGLWIFLREEVEEK